MAKFLVQLCYNIEANDMLDAMNKADELREHAPDHISVHTKE